MNLDAIMQEVADLVDEIPGLRVQGWPAETISAPAAVVTYPETSTPDLTYGNGAFRTDPSVVVLVGNVYKKTTRQNVSAYASDDGPQSIKAAIESKDAGEYTSFDDIRVTGTSYEVYAIGAIEYLAATFTLDIIGSGD